MKARIDYDTEPTDADLSLAARHSDAVQRVQVLQYQQAAIKAEATRKCEMLRPQLEQAKARLARLMPAYNDMCYRLRIDPHTDLDLPDEEEEE